MSNDAHATRLPPRYVLPARALWLALTALTVAAYVVTLPIYYANFQSICLSGDCSDQRLNAAQAVAWSNLGYIMPDFAALMIGVYIVFGAFFLATGILIFLRKADDWLALFVSLTLIVFGLMTFQSDVDALPPSLMRSLVELLTYLGNVSIFVFFAIFPSGRPVPRWIWIFSAVWAVYEFFEQVAPDLLGRPSRLVPTFNALLFLLMVASSVFAQIYRYRFVSNAREKQQTKWVVYGTGLGVGTFLVLVTLFGLIPQREMDVRVFVFGNIFLYLTLLFVPLSITIAILRSRLWDIDIIIRRTVTYAIVVALLTVVYFGSVILLQQLFANLTGARSEVITMLSTLAIAALFIPLRNRVQNAIDKRFNRNKYDAEQILRHFAETVRDETNLENLAADLLNVVNETMQPKSASLWLQQDKGGKNQK